MKSMTGINKHIPRHRLLKGAVVGIGAVAAISAIAGISPLLAALAGRDPAAARRDGALAAIDSMNHFFLNHEVFVVGSTY
jgi:hypothetical protein